MRPSNVMKKLSMIWKLCKIGAIIGVLLAVIVIAAMLLDDLNIVSIIIMIGIFSFVIFLWVETA